MIHAVVWLLASITLLGQLLIVCLFIIYTLRLKFLFVVKKFINTRKLPIVFFISSTATLGSLFYSEVIGLTPCILCWWQRILMYPQTVLSFLAIQRREKTIVPYLIVLNFIGLPISLYHYLIQRLPADTTSTICQIGGTVSCTKDFSLYFGYITIPLMAATAFLLSLIVLNIKKSK